MEPVSVFGILGATLLIAGHSREKNRLLHKLKSLPSIRSSLARNVTPSAKLIQVDIIGDRGIKSRTIDTILLNDKISNHGVRSLGFRGDRKRLSRGELKDYTDNLGIDLIKPCSSTNTYEVKESTEPVYEYDDGDEYVVTDNIDRLAEHIADKNTEHDIITEMCMVSGYMSIFMGTLSISLLII